MMAIAATRGMLLKALAKSICAVGAADIAAAAATGRGRRAWLLPPGAGENPPGMSDSGAAVTSDREVGAVMAGAPCPPDGDGC